MNVQPTHVSLFTGIAGIDIAAEAAGFETLLQVEIADYQRALLWKHWPDVPKIEDIRNVTRERIDELGIRYPTVLSGGFPCQPFSTAGKRKGKDDDRYLWPEIIRVARHLKPSWIVGENVAGIISMEQPEPVFEVERGGENQPVHKRIVPELLEDLKKEGFLVPRRIDGTPIVFGIPASAVGACHKRERIFFVAYNKDNRLEGRSTTQRWEAEDPLGRESGRGSESVGQNRNDAPHSDKGGCCPGEPQGMRIHGGIEACHEAGAGDQPDPDTSGERSGELLLLEWEQGNTDTDAYGGCKLNTHVDFGERSQQFYFSRARWIREQAERGWKVPWHETATRFCRNFHGIPTELDGFDRQSYCLISRRERIQRIRSLENAVVPNCIFPIFEAIAKIERMMG